ncbi:MAG: BamA/TamA family outer membrane protein [Bacteroidales bacterium]|nr:BamA/TamA family outer membrane protein [Bacteroidales bacterium]
MKVRFLIYGWLIFSLFWGRVSAQSVVIFSSNDSVVVDCAHKAGLFKKVKNRAKLEERLDKWTSLCKRNGYLSFSVDSVITDSSHFYIDFYSGPRWKCAIARISDAVSEELSVAGLSSYNHQGVLNLTDYDIITAQLIRYFENHGYPFAEAYLDNISSNRDSLVADLMFDRHTFISVDSIVVKGTAKLRNAYLFPYLRLRKKKAYDESVMRAVPQKIDEMPFATVIRPSGVEFVQDKATLYLFLDKKKTNQFDGFFALVPENEQTGKVGFAGELNLALKNLIGIGEEFAVSWRCPAPRSQYLNVNLEFPYLFRTPFGVSGKFLLDKTDTTYLNMNYRIGVRYSFLSNAYLQAYFDYSTSDLLDLSMLQVFDNELIYADYKKSMYGLSFSYSNLDFIYNPRKGISALVDVSVGKRKIVRDARVDESLYEGVRLNSVKYRLVASLDGYIPLAKRWVLNLGARAGAILGPSTYTNELFKIGGLNSLRGFTEDEILATSYILASMEVRFLFAKIAYFNLFANAAFYERNLQNAYVQDFPFGFGLGLAFDTKAGVFYLNYALGRQMNNPILLKNGKIHFGIKVGF